MEALAYEFRWSVIGDSLPGLLTGLKWTLLISGIAIGGSVLVGVVGGAIRAHRIRGLDQLVAMYVEVFRNTPLLVQIFFWFFALPELGLRLRGFTVAWVALTAWGGAFNIENFRAGFEAVGATHREGGRALGMRPLDIFTLITLPMGIRIAIPSVTNILISVLKSSSLMAAIGFPELTEKVVNIVSLSFRVFEMFFVLAVVYLGLVWMLSGLLRFAENRLAIPGQGG